MINWEGYNLFPFDYISEIAQEVISKLPLIPRVIITLLVLVIISYFTFNKGIFDKWAKFHREKLNRFLTIMFIVLFSCLVVFYLVDHVYFPKPPEDQLVVAISPFYLTDEYGKHGDDSNTADDLEERIKAEKDLEIKVIRLDNPIRDEEDAKTQGKKVGAHLVIYGETKSKIGEIGEIKCHILPLSSLEIIPSKIFSLEVMAEERDGLIITEKAT
ncbi:MAG: hypothetical protein KAU52_04685, partial [Methanosarcinales archaeon]|nr:hypothetical protein [Methanosarcinales archaeon]